MSTSDDASVCRMREELPVDKDLVALAERRREILAESMADATSRARVRDYFKEALESRTNLHYAYRHLAGTFQLEADLMLGVNAFAPVDGDDIYQCSVPDLKLLRRVAFQRYAFELASEVNRRLRLQGEARWWLLKDFLLLRIPLALLIGYGAVFGAGTVNGWLWALRNSPAFVLLLTAGSLFVTGFLVYLNVRDRLGDVPWAAERAAIVLGIAVLYCVAFTTAGRLITLLVPDLPFDWGSTILVTDCALTIAVIVQFFFAKSGSIADPL